MEKQSENKLRDILETADVPEALIRELEAKPAAYRQDFLSAIEAILQNEVLSLLAFMQTKENIEKQFFSAGVQ